MEHTLSNNNTSTNDKILVVDDSLVVLDSLKDLLSINGFDVITKQNSKSAISYLALHDSEISLIISDIRMPELDGFHFLHQVRKLKYDFRIPFIFLTSAEEEVSKAKELGIDDFISKPFTPQEIVSSIKGCLKKSLHTKDELAEKTNAHKHIILNTLTHEFNTPLVLISNGIELLQKELKGPKEVECLKIIKQGSEQLMGIINNMLSAQQIELKPEILKGQIEKQKKNIKFEHVVQRGILEYLNSIQSSSRASLPDIKFRISPLFNDIYINIAPNYVSIAIAHIISNAHKFNKKDAAIEITMKKHDDFAICCIRDFGCSMDKKMFDNLCKMFTQLNREKQEQQGCGLGLAIASSYINMNGGTLSFRKPNDDEDGSILRICFPIQV